MKCPRCGREVSDNARFCEVCGSPVGATFVLAVPPAKTSKPVLVAVIVAVVIITVAGIGVGAYLYYAPDLHPDLTLYYDYGGLFSDPFVMVDGMIYNYGHSAGYAAIHFTISDSRGWSRADIISTERIEPNGGHVYVNKMYSWPDPYLDQHLQNYNGDVVPTWTYDIDVSR